MTVIVPHSPSTRIAEPAASTTAEVRRGLPVWLLASFLAALLVGSAIGWLLA